MLKKQVKGMKSLSSLLEAFKTIKNTPPNTLFDIPLEWDKVKEDLCPYCGRKLHFPFKAKVAYCKRKTCVAPNKGFLISLNTLGKIKASQSDKRDFVKR